MNAPKRRHPPLVLLVFLAASAALQAQNRAPVLSQPHYSASGVFQCEIIVDPDTLCEVQVSSDLKTWRSLAQIRPKKPSYHFEDPAAANFDPRFYRVLGPIVDQSPAVVDIFPPSASPGMSVRITTKGASFTEEGPNTVWFDDMAVPALWVGREDQAEVLVPNHPGGEAGVRVQLQGQRPGVGWPLQILAPRTRLLVLSYEKGALKLLGDYPSGDQPTRPPSSDERRLSFDILNSEGGLLASCAVRHPSIPLEVFDDPGKGDGGFSRVPAPEQPVFAVKVSVVPGQLRIRCFDAEPGADLTLARDRATRRFLNELELNVR